MIRERPSTKSEKEFVIAEEGIEHRSAFDFVGLPAQSRVNAQVRLLRETKTEAFVRYWLRTFEAIPEEDKRDDFEACCADAYAKAASDCEAQGVAVDFAEIQEAPSRPRPSVRTHFQGAPIWRADKPD